MCFLQLPVSAADFFFIIFLIYSPLFPLYLFLHHIFVNLAMQDLGTDSRNPIC